MDPHKEAKSLGDQVGWEEELLQASHSRTNGKFGETGLEAVEVSYLSPNPA